MNKKRKKDNRTIQERFKDFNKDEILKILEIFEEVTEENGLEKQIQEKIKNKKTELKK